MATWKLESHAGTSHMLVRLRDQRPCKKPDFLRAYSRNGCKLRFCSPCKKEVRMPARLVFLLMVVLALPAASQHSNMQQHINQRIDQKIQRNDEMITGRIPSQPNAQALRLQSIHH